MYIAFKWLVFLSSIMWLTMCVVDLLIKENLKIRNAVLGVGSKQFEDYKNMSVNIQPKSIQDTVHRSLYKEKSLPGIHFIMFLTGALAVTAFQKKQEIIVFANRNISSLNVSCILRKILYNLKNAATKSRVTISKHLPHLWGKVKVVLLKVYKKVIDLKMLHTVKDSKIHMILLKKLKEMAEERKNMSQLLITAIRENKNIRMRYELENMTKTRLMQRIQITQKQIKENRSRYVNFQHLYLVAHQENMYLKTCLRKIRQEKEETEKNLIGLINEVYRSKNNKLKAYCTRFIVKTKDKILNNDMNAEIKEFLEKNYKSSEITVSQERSAANQIPSKSWVSCTNPLVTDDDNSLMPLVAEEPKLRGLPGECVWTVKDKDGIIEKLYEYDFESDFDNGDTIRRIRQYSVYYDKDCFLDFSKLGRQDRAHTSVCPSGFVTLEHSASKQKIVTDSEAFQKFLQSNIGIVQTKP